MIELTEEDEEPSKDHDFRSLVCIYAQLLPEIRTVGKSLGYAVALHGTMARDLDLIAVPWVEGAANEDDLVRAICKAVAGYVVSRVDDNGHVEERPTIMPHGRRSWTIVWGGKPFIDLSVMPRSRQLAPDTVTLPVGGFPNPLQVRFGYGGIKLNMFCDGDGAGLILAPAVGDHKVGDYEREPDIDDYEPQMNEIYLHFANAQSADIMIEILREVQKKLTQSSLAAHAAKTQERRRD